MSLTATERNALQRLRRYITLERAALTPPARAGEAFYWKAPAERRIRPLSEFEQPDLDRDPFVSNAWTNDVAESLRIYTESWILPIIDLLLEDDSYSRTADLKELAR